MATCLSALSAPTPITITCSVTDTLKIWLVKDTYTVWNPWGIYPVQCTNSAGCPYTGESTDKMGWVNQFHISTDGGSTYDSYSDGQFRDGTSLIGGYTYPTADDAFNGAEPLFLTGHSEYKITIYDDPYTDNSGGLCFEWEIIPAVTNALMFSCNT